MPDDHNELRVLGVDPGSRKLGWAVLVADRDGVRVVASGTLTPPKSAALAARLGFLLNELAALLSQHRVDALAVEQAFVYKNPKTALVIGQARGLPIALAAARGLSVHEYQPSVVKRAVVGSGRASKEQVRHMVQLQLRLPDLPQEDEADALAIALTHTREVAHRGGVEPELLAVSRGAQARGGWEAAAPPPPTDARAYYAAVVAAAKGRKRR